MGANARGSNRGGVRGRKSAVVRDEFHDPILAGGKFVIVSHDDYDEETGEIRLRVGCQQAIIDYLPRYLTPGDQDREAAVAVIAAWMDKSEPGDVLSLGGVGVVVAVRPGTIRQLHVAWLTRYEPSIAVPESSIGVTPLTQAKKPKKRPSR